ncbi:MAG: serine/threonine-protein kinase [Deltaproteobacteria bacterium]|nr:serine/threonine-protein kinase [Deltaproteobacteria bacterium]
MQLPYRFGRYCLTGKIAQGGMAEIFRAKYSGESGFSKEVVIKRLLPIWSDNPDFVRMLVDEAKALVHLSHPNIVQVFELGRDQKTFYISMEFVDGIDLRQFFLHVTQNNLELPLSLVLFIITEILKALDYAHQKKNAEGNPLQIIHRDISPQNILLSFEGQVKVADFGIAKGTHRSHETTQAYVKGKYAYMSPEQARGEKVGVETDLYAVGILLYELLEKKRLFDGVNDLATLEQVREARLPNNALQKWPAPLKVIVLKSLQKESRYRYATAKEFLADVNRHALRENCMGDVEALTAYLKKTMPGLKKREPEPEIKKDETIAYEISPKKNRRFLKPAAVAILFIIAVVIGVGESKEIKPVVVSHIPTLQASASVATPASEGSITIDAKPKPLNGVLKMGKVEKEFVTPFHMGGLDVSEESEGTVKLKLENGKEVSEKIVLSSANPDWVKTFEIEKEKPGVLKVAAKPWGEVTIPGVVAERETPLKALNLEEGKYRVKIHYPPSGQWMEKEILMAKGSEIFCQAEFSTTPKMVCK